MSDIHVDKLNNSQLILLTLLISLVVSAATAVATLSAVYERLARTETGTSDTSQPTVIKQTINRIIEREPVLPTANERNDINTMTTSGETGQQYPTDSSSDITLEDIENAFVQLHFGSQPFALGIYVSPKGVILSAEPLDRQRRYSVIDSIGNITYFSVVHSEEAYSLLAPTRTHTATHYISLTQLRISLGQPILIYGGFGDEAQLHTGIVSQKRTAFGETASFRTSVESSSVTQVSAVFINNTLAGFIAPFSSWIPVITPELITQSSQKYDHLFDDES